MNVSNALASTLLDSVDSLIILTDAQGRVLLGSRSWERLTGMPTSEQVGQRLWELPFVRTGRGRLHRALTSDSSSQYFEPFESTITASDGSHRQVRWSSVVPCDGNGDGVAHMITGLDVSDNHRMRHELRETTHDLSERIKELNCLYAISSLIEERAGSVDEILQAVVDLIPPAWQYPDATCARIVLDSQEVASSNFSPTPWKLAASIHAAGREVGRLEVCYLREMPTGDEGPFLKEERELVREIAERVGEVIARRWAAEALRNSEELHRMTLSNISDTVFIADDAGAFTYVCPNVHVLFGYTQTEAEALGSVDALLGENLYKRARLDAAGELSNIHRSVRDKHGKTHELLVNVKRVAIKDGTVLITCRDVTELRRAEEQVRRHQAELAHVSRLHTMGEMASGLAHELNQPLSAIVNYANGCIRRLEDGAISPEDLMSALSLTAEEATRAGEILKRLRQFVRKGEQRSVLADVNQIVRDAVVLAAADLKQHRIEATLNLDANLPRISVDPIQVEQVILNLVRNAIEAMENISPHRRRLLIRTKPEGPRGVEVAVSDQGPGMSTEALEQVFTPFFTTKQEGMGIGLSISRSIVEGHGGRMWVEPHDEAGVTFRFTLSD